MLKKRQGRHFCSKTPFGFIEEVRDTEQGGILRSVSCEGDKRIKSKGTTTKITMDKSPSSHNSGIALLMTLFVLVFLSIIAMNFTFSTRWGTASTRNFKEEIMAYYHVMSAYQEVLAYLLSDKDTTVDFIDEEGNLYLDKETEPLKSKRITDEAEIEIKITDEGSKVNINKADKTKLENLLTYVGVPDDSRQEIADSILDWIDSDKEHRLSGAEDEYYETLTPSYKAKNRSLDTVEELLLIKGFKQGFLYGSDEIKPLYDLITTVGDGSININTASREILQLLGASSIDIENIFKQRTKETGGVKQIPLTISSAGTYRTTSSIFRIEVTAAMKGSNQSLKITSIVKRAPAIRGFDIQNVYWRESFESRRS
jgi:general secretion pathway protein K